ncbi:MAG: hypothetical protein D6769_01100, partial [Methanobacteriota archaeon]
MSLDKEFKEFTASLGFQVSGLSLLTKKDCIRVASKYTMSFKGGEKGLCVFTKKGPTPSFLPVFRKDIACSISVDRETLEQLFSKKPIAIDFDDGFYA